MNDYCDCVSPSICCDDLRLAKRRIEELEAAIVISKGKHENCIRDNERLRGVYEAAKALKYCDAVAGAEAWEDLQEALAAVQERPEQCEDCDKEPGGCSKHRAAAQESDDD